MSRRRGEITRSCGGDRQWENDAFAADRIPYGSLCERVSPAVFSTHTSLLPRARSVFENFGGFFQISCGYDENKMILKISIYQCFRVVWNPRVQDSKKITFGIRLKQFLSGKTSAIRKRQMCLKKNNTFKKIYTVYKESCICSIKIFRCGSC